ncbi:MAG: aminoglycoside phosphotransferase family protein [Erysipelotrichales bacterium]|nr:aminoglycoside phosphotransferase family protein [Erysipelotrichales bacterium]
MQEILSNFNIKGKFISCVNFGLGDINLSYEVIFNENGTPKKYLLQRINHKVFRNIEGLINNISLVTEYLKNKILEEGGNPTRETLTLIKTKNGQNFYYDEEVKKYFRLYLFIEEAITFEKTDDLAVLKEAGRAISHFVEQLADFDNSQLISVIPNLHNSVRHYENLFDSLKKDNFYRSKLIEQEVAFVKERESELHVIKNLIANQKIPLRVTHNDTKLNNILFESKNKKAICIIDLDTIMPGTVLFDYGDAIRYAASTSLEDEKDLSKVKLDIKKFEAFTEGYLTAGPLVLNQTELDYLVFAAKIVTLECGIRFLTDFLNGDVYFKTSRAQQNLDRARTQFKLVEEMEKHYETLLTIVQKIRIGKGK